MEKDLNYALNNFELIVGVDMNISLRMMKA